MEKVALERGLGPFWSVLGAFRGAPGEKVGDKCSTTNRKNEKTKKQYGHRALSRSAPGTQEKRFLRGSENVLFFGCFFIENGLSTF